MSDIKSFFLNFIQVYKYDQLVLPYCLQANEKENKDKKKTKNITGYAGHSVLQGSVQQNNAVISYYDLRNKKEQVF